MYAIRSYYEFSIEDCFYNDIDLSNDEELSIGEVVEIEDEHNPKNKEIWVICKGWILILKQVKLEWKKSMDILSFVNWNVITSYSIHYTKLYDWDVLQFYN